MYAVSILIIAGLLVLALTLLAIHWGFRAPRVVPQGTPKDVGLAYEDVELSTSGGQRLHAWLLPAAPNAACVVLLHGWGGNAEMMLPLALPLHRAGLNVLLLDARNHGLSDTDTFSSLPRFAEDVGNAVDWLKARLGGAKAKIALLGHSVGAGAVLFEASRRNDISAVISIGSFAHPDWLMRRQLQRLRMPKPMIDLILRYVEWVIGHSYDEIAPLNTVCRVACPVLLVHGTADRVVPISDFEAINRNCGGEQTETLLVGGAGHQSMEAIERHSKDLLDFLRRAGVRGASMKREEA